MNDFRLGWICFLGVVLATILAAFPIYGRTTAVQSPNGTRGLVPLATGGTLLPAGDVGLAKVLLASSQEGKAVSLVAQGFGQDGSELGFGFLLENPNVNLAIKETRYQVAAYDAEGVVVGTESGYVELLLPNQRLGISGTMYIDKGTIVSRIVVQLSTGEPETSESLLAFKVDSAWYHASDFSAKATGVISNPYNFDITNLRVSALAYNAAGEIVGGGFGFLGFILAGSTTGVELSVTSSADVVSVKLYPTFSGLSTLTSNRGVPSDARDLTLLKEGFGQDGQEAGFGFLLENPNDTYLVDETEYHITAYAGNGEVLGTEEGYVNTLLPRQILGVGGNIFVQAGETIAHLDVQIKAGSFNSPSTLPPFTADKATYRAGEFSSEVTGHILNPYSKDVTNLRVSAIVYNDTGDIIGGGFTYLDFVPANGKAAVEVPVTNAGTPAFAELYGTVSSITDFR